MISGLADLALPFLRALDPEHAHELTLKAMEAGLYPRPLEGDDTRLAQNIWGLDFPNPIGIAAGFDKDARVPQAILDSGFGFAEVGTLTPRPQTGNPRPRVFRLPEDRAMINRLGFNNGGHARALARLARRKPSGIVGVNIGYNKDAMDPQADYLAGLETFSPVADYFTVNISSPNTPGLRDLQAPGELDKLLARLMAKRDALVQAGSPSRPITVKISPDLAADDIAPICERLVAHGVDGIIVSNTTLDRAGLKSSEHVNEAGGLSGAPLYEPSTGLLGKVYVLTQGQIPLIGVGGISTGKAALGKIEAGASLVQLYTGLVYEGPGLIPRIKKALIGGIERAGVSSIAGLVGKKAESWAAKAQTERKQS